MLAGIVGNLIDRVRLGEVVDFIDLHWRTGTTGRHSMWRMRRSALVPVFWHWQMIKEERAEQNDMFPELFKIPGTEFTLNTYGFLQALSFVAGILLMARLAERDGISRQRAYDLGLWILAVVADRFEVVAGDHGVESLLS
jgi:hypothetical protein